MKIIHFLCLLILLLISIVLCLVSYIIIDNQIWEKERDMEVQKILYMIRNTDHSKIISNLESINNSLKDWEILTN